MRLRALLVAAAFALLLPACGFFDALFETEDALRDSGFRDPSVSLHTIDGRTTLAVSWSSGAETVETLLQEMVMAAEVVWASAPVRLDAVFTEPDVPALSEDAPPVRRFLRSELLDRFGPRPKGLDKDVSDALGVDRFVRRLALVWVGTMAVIAGIIVVVVRSRRRPPVAVPWPVQPGPGYWPPMPPQSYPPPPPWAAPPPAEDPYRPPS